MAKKATKKAPAKKKAVRKNSTPPFAEYPDWSEAKFFSFIRSALRAAWSRWPPKYQLLAKAKRKYEGPNKRLKWEFLCNECKNYYPQKEISVDHIDPAGTLRTFEDIGLFCQRLFVGEDKLQVLCSECHRQKTSQEREERKNNKETK